MTAHRLQMHRTKMAIDWNRLPVSQMGHHPQVYYMSFPREKNGDPEPFPDAQVPLAPVLACEIISASSTGGGGIRILEEHPTPFPKCERCGIQVPQWRLNDRHYESENANWERHHGSTVIPYSADLGQVGSLSISIPSPYLRWRPYPNF